jgi:hypothetical protein
MGTHYRWRVVVAWAAIASEIETFARRPERQNLFTLGQSLKQMILRLVGGAFPATLKTEHAFELALAEVPQCTTNAQVNMEGATVRAKWLGRLVFCGHDYVPRWLKEKSAKLMAVNFLGCSHDEKTDLPEVQSRHVCRALL